MKTILMIDDDRVLCEEYRDILESEGYCVSVEYNGISGKKTMENANFDVLILDIKIPGLNGFKLLKWMREEKYPVKIMVLTGRPLSISGHLKDTNIEEEDLLTHANEVVNKPLKIEKLLGLIAMLLE